MMICKWTLASVERGVFIVLCHKGISLLLGVCVCLCSEEALLTWRGETEMAAFRIGDPISQFWSALFLYLFTHPVSVLYRLPTTETAAKMSNSRPKRRGNRTKSNG